MVVATAAAALASVQTVYNLVTAAQTLKTETEVRLAISGMLDEVNAAKIAIGQAIDAEFALKQRIRELEEENRKLKERDSELERYERKQFQPGTIAYTLKPELNPDGEPHHACANCYETRKQISSLQSTDRLGRRRHRIHRCPSCGSEYEMGPEVPPSGGAPINYSNKGIL